LFNKASEGDLSEGYSKAVSRKRHFESTYVHIKTNSMKNERRETMYFITSRFWTHFSLALPQDTGCVNARNKRKEVLA
jgi:hypothetical protein